MPRLALTQLQLAGQCAEHVTMQDSNVGMASEDLSLV